MSLGSPRRLIGMAFWKAFAKPPSKFPSGIIDLSKGVSTGQGATELQQIQLRANSIERVIVKAISPPLQAE